MKLSAIKKDCQKKLAKAITNTAKDADRIVEDSFEQYYGGGSPQVYQRTNTLPGTKKIDPPVIGGNTVSLDAGYEPGQISYNTGTPGYPVFEATAEGFGGTVGDKSYDEQALEKVIESADKNFGAQFG